MDHLFRLIDVFTDQPLSGNQLAVFPEGEKLDGARLQAIGRELNLSETVFLFPPRNGGDARMRIFTTVEELPFAGHPVLGTACLLALEKQRVGRIEMQLETGRGRVKVAVEVGKDGSVSGWMEQPLPTVQSWNGDQSALFDLLGLRESMLPLEVYDNGLHHLYAMAPTEELVRGIRPDFSRMGQICGDVRVNCFAGAGDRYTTRMFSPFDYVPEDPACGSAAGPLAAHLVRHGLLESGREIRIEQGAQVGRPSVLFARAEGNAQSLHQVLVGGSAVVMGEGRLRLPGV